MNAGRLAAWSTIASVTAAIVAGLIISGSPLGQREIRFDERRVADLRRLSSAIERYYRDTRRLPASLDALVDGQRLTSLPRDPVTDMAYSYSASGGARYRLCADFSREADAPAAGYFWAHASGRECFDFDYSSLRFD